MPKRTKAVAHWVTIGLLMSEALGATDQYESLRTSQELEGCRMTKRREGEHSLERVK